MVLDGLLPSSSPADNYLGSLLILRVVWDDGCGEKSEKSLGGEVAAAASDAAEAGLWRACLGNPRARGAAPWFVSALRVWRCRARLFLNEHLISPPSSYLVLRVQVLFFFGAGRWYLR